MLSTLHVNLDHRVDDSYAILIGVNPGGIVGDIRRTFWGVRKFVITDSNVGALYGKEFLRALRQPREYLLSIPAGEKSKNRRIKERIEDRILSLGVTRDSLIVALGGGVIGDLAGFVAASLLRGLPYVQIPTTLLAQVDSSIGGKVAIDHPLGKNLLGAFYQPHKVYINVATLTSLPDREFRCGLAEVIKYGAILDKDLFRYLEREYGQIMAKHESCLLRIIKRSCEIKKSVVEQDEKETGLRRILNFGHTIGHAIEVLSGYRIRHGNAIAIGMVAEARMSV